MFGKIYIERALLSKFRNIALKCLVFCMDMIDENSLYMINFAVNARYRVQIKLLILQTVTKKTTRQSENRIFEKQFQDKFNIVF